MEVLDFDGITKTLSADDSLSCSITVVTCNVSDYFMFETVLRRWQRVRNAKRKREEEVAEHNELVYKETVNKRCKVIRERMHEIREELNKLRAEKRGIKKDLGCRILDSETPVNRYDFV